MITPGTILVQKGTPLPPPFRVENESYPAWMTVKCSLSAHGMEREFAAAGWTFLFMAGRIRATAFGFDKEKSVHKALGRLIASVKLQKCNCLEIDEVAARAFCGIPYVSVSAHARHIQKGLLFSGIDDRNQAAPPDAAATPVPVPTPALR